MTQNDGVTNSPAYVLAVPYYHNNNINAGNIYLFMSEENVADMIPTGAYDLAGSFAICDNKGNVLVQQERKHSFLTIMTLSAVWVVQYLQMRMMMCTEW